MGTLPFRPVVAIDVDNTIGDYTNHFLRFAQEYLGPEYDLEYNWSSEFKGEFSEALGLDKRTYRDVKLAYRQGGSKRTMPVFDGAAHMVEAIRSAGAEVWFCTTRPWMRLDNIDPDTREFFRRNGLDFDGLIYGEEKYQDLVDIVGAGRIVCVLDDLPEQIQNAQDLGLHAILRRGSHNKWFRPSRGTARIQRLKSAEKYIISEIEEWKEQKRHELLHPVR